MTSPSPSGTGFRRFIVRQSKAILFLTLCVCLAGVLSAGAMPSSVFPQTDFPRVVVLIDNGVMPGDQMMATVTRPVEEAMKDIPGVVSVRSATGRGSAEVNVFFNWSVDMQKSELHVHSRLAQIRAQLPATASTTVHRLTFSAFPVVGLSLTSTAGRTQPELWDAARYDIKPRLLRVPGVARVDLVGGRRPEYHVKIDPAKLEGYHLALAQVSEPHMGDFLVKLKADRKRSVEEVKDDLRERIHAAEPALEVDMPDILSDLIGDLTWSPKPIEIKVFSMDVPTLKEKAKQIAEIIDSKDGKGIPGVVDVNDGLMYTGSAQTYRPRSQDLLRYGIKSDDVARTLNIALLGETPSSVLKGDRQVNIRLLVDPKFVKDSAAIDSLLVRSELGGSGTRLSAVTDRRVESGQLELRREDLRQNVAVTARTSNRDLGSSVRDIKAKLD